MNMPKRALRHQSMRLAAGSALGLTLGLELALCAGVCAETGSACGGRGAIGSPLVSALEMECGRSAAMETHASADARPSVMQGASGWAAGGCDRRARVAICALELRSAKRSRDRCRAKPAQQRHLSLRERRLFLNQRACTLKWVVRHRAKHDRVNGHQRPRQSWLGARAEQVEAAALRHSLRARPA